MKLGTSFSPQLSLGSNHHNKDFSSAQAQWAGLAMPTVSVKRDLLFRALGRTYSECASRSLCSAPLLGGWDPLAKRRCGHVYAARRFWPRVWGPARVGQPRM